MAVATSLRTRVYIDGYNLYYGCLKDTQYKWLNLHHLFEQHILPSSSLPGTVSKLLPPGIKYFTAKILDKPARALDSVSSQARYHTALRKLYANQIELIEGYYSLTESKAKMIDVNDPDRWPRDCTEVLVWKLEEKQSDVNLALQAYHDAITGSVDQVVIVTNDTDLAPMMRMLRRHTNVISGLVIPTRPQSRVPNTELIEQAHWTRAHITSAELAASQLPRVIPGKRPTIKPKSWYARPDLLNAVLDMAVPVRGSMSKAFKWMEEANPHFGGKAPIDLVESDEGAAEVMSYIQKFVETKHKQS